MTEDVDETIPFEALAVFDCQVCGRRAMTSFAAVAARHESVREFLRERDAALEDRPYWDVERLVAGEGVAVRSRNPWLVEVRFEADDEARRVTVDGALAVVDVEELSGDADDELSGDADDELSDVADEELSGEGRT